MKRACVGPIYGFNTETMEWEQQKVYRLSPERGVTLSQLHRLVDAAIEGES